jgi:uncharacterized membrane protein SpoIIM required for sporulation
VDIDRYIATNQPAWDRLDELSSRATTRVSSLDADELDELVQLYQRSSAQLSHVRTHYGDPQLTTALSGVVGRANQAVYGLRGRGLGGVGRFFASTFPAAVWDCRRPIGVSAAVFFLPAVVVCLWLLNSPAALEASASPGDRSVYVNDLFEQYYYDRAPWQFFAEVTLNNIFVSFQAFAGAATAGVITVVVLFVNGAGVGQAAAWMIHEGEAARFWGYILPHGMLELSAVVIAGGAAFRLGWVLLVPGDRTRAEALRAEGLRTITVILGLVAMFVVAGLIEGFITGRGLPVGLRVGIGALGWLAALAYFGLLGRSAHAAGDDGRLGPPPRTWDEVADIATVGQGRPRAASR